MHCRRLSGTGSGEHGPELVLLPGWGFSSRVWGAESAPEWLGSLRSIGPVTLVEIDDPGIADSQAPWTQLAARLPERAIWLGWSLGGMLAAELAARYPGRCLALITLASNACFAARPDWPDAMPAATFQRFYSDFQASPDTTWRRFLGLCAQQSAIETGACRWNADALPNLRLLEPEAKAGQMQPLDARATLRRLRELQALPYSNDLQTVNTAQPARIQPLPGSDQPPDGGWAPTTDKRLLHELQSASHTGSDKPISSARPTANSRYPAQDAALAGADASAQRLLRGLDVLAALDTRNALAQLRCPTLHLLAAGDALVPPGAAQRIAALNPNAQVAIVPGSHALHLSAADRVLEQLRGLLLAHDLWRPQRDKRAVAQSFSRAATSYDAVAHLQQKVCRQLLQRLPDEFATQGRWLDLGCGTGAALPMLAARMQPKPGGQWEQPAMVALDLAEGMLRLAREREAAHVHRVGNGKALSTTQIETVYICGDAERLPLADASIDGAISSLAVQWCDDLTAVCAELARVLRPGGRIWIATLGPDTLDSLRRAWSGIDDRVHVNRFSQRSEWQAAINASGLILDHWEERPEILHYPDVLALARELKALGANNLNAGRPTGLTGRQRLAQLRAAYEQYRQPAGLPAEYQVWYLELRRSESDGASSDTPDTTGTLPGAGDA